MHAATYRKVEFKSTASVRGGFELMAAGTGLILKLLLAYQTVVVPIHLLETPQTTARAALYCFSLGSKAMT